MMISIYLFLSVLKSKQTSLLVNFARFRSAIKYPFALSCSRFIILIIESVMQFCLIYIEVMLKRIIDNQLRISDIKSNFSFKQALYAIKHIINQRVIQ